MSKSQWPEIAEHIGKQKEKRDAAVTRSFARAWFSLSPKPLSEDDKAVHRAISR